MNVRPEDYDAVIVFKMTASLKLAGWGLNESDRVKARKNYLQLVRRHPDLAAQYGFEEENLNE